MADVSVGTGFLELIATMAPLPSPPVWRVWLLESPWLPAIGLAAVGVALFVALGRRQQARLGAAIGGAAVLAAAMVVATAFLVTTERERLIDGTKRFMRAAAAGDSAAVAPLLGEDVGLVIEGARIPGFGKAATLRLVESVEERFAFRDFGVVEAQAAVVGRGMGRAQAHVRVQPRDFYPSFSWWGLEWRKDGGGEWRIEAIECLMIDGRRPGQWLMGEVERMGRE